MDGGSCIPLGQWPVAVQVESREFLLHLQPEHRVKCDCLHVILPVRGPQVEDAFPPAINKIIQGICSEWYPSLSHLREQWS